MVSFRFWLVAALVLVTRVDVSSALLTSAIAFDGIGDWVANKAESHVRAWFDVVESELAEVDYLRVPSCSPDSVPYINAVIHITNKTWLVHCGDLLLGDRGPALKSILNTIVPDLPAEVNVYVPFGLHDGVHNVKAENKHVPVLGAVYHPLYSPIAVPFAMGCQRSTVGYVNTPVVGWDKHVKEFLTCNASTRPPTRKAVFRGKAISRSTKYGTCERACSWEDNGRLLIHKLGETMPDLFDTAVSNIGEFFEGGARRISPSQMFLPWPQQVCNYQAVLNIGSNADWAERLRQSFYGNAIVMVPENPPAEFFTSFMEPWKTFWPIKPDLADIVKQVSTVMSLNNLTQQLQAQRDFAATYLTEKFMYLYNKLVIAEYYRRKLFAELPQGPSLRSADHAAEARQLLGLRGCRSPRHRECPGDAPPVMSGWR